MRWILASDIDNTLTGDRAALDTLRKEIEKKREEGELFLILSTGRRLSQVLEGFAEEGIPKGDAVISQVGTEIYLPPFREGEEPLEVWNDMLMQDFSRKEAESFLEGVEGVEMQPEEFNTPLKVSCFLDSAENPEAAVDEIRRRVATAGGLYQVVWSSGRDLDIIPAAAGKGRAIRFLVSLLELEPEKIIVAGDSGNDRSMFDEFECGIVVGNAKPELLKMREERAVSTYYFAEKSFAAGVHEGLQYFGVTGK
ncbi:MAG: HAD-IIB family hydrolase [Spirochaetaceae bacterium]